MLSKFIVFFFFLHIGDKNCATGLEVSQECGNTESFTVRVWRPKGSYLGKVDGCITDPDITMINLESKLYKLESGTFVNITKLNSITIQEKYIEKLEPGFIVNSPNLKYIYAANNRIRLLKKGVFNQMNLSDLVLNSNQMYTIHEGAFANMNASWLDLANNRLNVLNGKWFENTFIQRLDLSYNTIKSLNKNVFDGIRSLRSINLNRNSINFIESSAFSELRDLAELRLADNNLEHLNFINNLELNYLDIGLNKISNIVIGKSSKVDKILIYPNPWNCNCLKKFWQYAWKNNMEYGESEMLIYPWSKQTIMVCVPREGECNESYIDKFVQARYLKFVDYDQLRRNYDGY